MHSEQFGVGTHQEEEHSSDSVFPGQPFGDSLASLESPFMPAELQDLWVLFSAFRVTDTAEIEEDIKPFRLLLASCHPHIGDRSKSLAIGAISIFLLHAFQLTNNIEYVNEAISILQEGSSLPNAERIIVFPLLITSLTIRFDLRHAREDLGEMMQLYQMANDHRGVTIQARFGLSCQ